MRHPSTRAERRYAREVARNRRRLRIYVYRSWVVEPQENGGWNRGGKQYFACGNRCFDSMTRRHERKQELKRLRCSTPDVW